MKKYYLLLFSILTLTTQAQDVTIEITSFATGLNTPVAITNAGDDRMFVVQQDGRIRIVRADGSLDSGAFLDIASQVSEGSEQGLLGLAFHPDYDNNGYFYVYYTDLAGDSVISRFEVSTDPDVADQNSELEILTFDQPFGNHNGGTIAFGPEGYLYIASGDGGSGGDPGNRAQNTELLLGKLLRIDVDNPSGGNNYGIPPDNPFAGNPPNAEEIWAYGLRNPWKFSFDAQTGDLWIGDVGQGLWEEIDYMASPDPGGQNYGWRCFEGNAPFDTDGCDPMETMTFPIAVYSSGPTSQNCSITGGVVYRGSAYPAIDGYYFFADLCSQMIGTVNNPSDPQYNEYGSFGGTWVAFGEDVNNELFIVDIAGTIYQVSGQAIAGVDDVSVLDFDMSPNPATSRLQIGSSEAEQLANVFIYDLKGSLLISQDLDGPRTQIDISNLSAGMYLIEVENEIGHKGVKKLVVR